MRTHPVSNEMGKIADPDVAPNRVWTILSRWRMVVAPHGFLHKKDALDYAILKESQHSSTARPTGRAKHNNRSCRGQQQTKATPKRSKRERAWLGVANQRSTLVTLDPVRQHLGGQVSVWSETDDETEMAEDPIAFGRFDAACAIGEAPKLVTYIKPSTSSPKLQFRGKPVSSCDSDDMSLFTSNESLVYGLFPNSFMSIVEEDDESSSSDAGCDYSLYSI